MTAVENHLVEVLPRKERRRPLAARRPARSAALQRDQGKFSSGTHTHLSQTLHYKLYTPPGHIGRQLPLVVMLHGCSQDPDDFDAGTGMNQRAREQGFFVLYPAQSQDANALLCWNWFEHEHQQRGSGEPALLASMTQAVIKLHRVDARRVYIAGLSAGGSMAAIVAATYPEIFAAVGVHSGLPYGAASNASEAFSVMMDRRRRLGPVCAVRPRRHGAGSADNLANARAHHRVPRRPGSDGAPAQW